MRFTLVGDIFACAQLGAVKCAGWVRNISEEAGYRPTSNVVVGSSFVDMFLKCGIVEGQRITPSVVACTKNGDRLVGQIAKRQAVVNPENTFFSVKSFIERKMSEVNAESKQFSYNVVRYENGNVKLDCPAIGK